MTTRYRVLCASLVTNTIREELAIDNLKFSYVLNAAGSFSGTISLDDPKCTRDNLDPGATAIYIERGGLLVWGGILWTAKVDTVSRSMQLGGEGFWSYFKYRAIKNRVGMQYATASSLDVHLPNSDVLKTNVTGSPDNTTVYTNVDDPSQTSVSTVGNFIYGTTAGLFEYRARANINGGDYSGFTIASVRVAAYGSESPGDGFITPTLNIGGVDYNGTNQSFKGTLGATAQLWPVSWTWTTNPATGLAWTASDVESFGSSNSFGFLGSTTNPGANRIYGLRLEISWGTSGTSVFLNADELGLARDIINNAQAQPGGSLGITVGSELTTDNGGTFVGRTITFHSYDRKNTAQAVEDLAKLENGFDFSIEVSWDSTGTIPQRQFVLYYPKRGRRIDTLVFNDNILGVSQVGVTVDATVAANSVDIIGSGDGDAMLIASQADTSLLSRYPLLEGVYSAKDITDRTLLGQQAAAKLARTKAPLENPSIAKQADTWPDFGSFQLGDEALVVTRDGWINIDSYQQIQQLEVQVSAEGQETMTPTFVSADGTVA
jgi:hypothetical protein